jgi:hypothetical protein
VDIVIDIDDGTLPMVLMTSFDDLNDNDVGNGNCNGHVEYKANGGGAMKGNVGDIVGTGNVVVTSLSLSMSGDDVNIVVV